MFSLHFQSYFTDFAGFFVSSVSYVGSRCHSFGCRTLTCQPWGVVRCSLSSRTASSLTHKNTQMMIMIAPADGDEPPQGRAGRGIGCYLSSDNSRCPYINLSCRSRKKVVAHSLFSSSLNVRICSSRDMLSSSYANVPFLMPSMIVLYNR